MANRVSQILSLWEPQKDQLQWVLATVVKTSGPCYRKTGAMMMVNSLGQWCGLLSGGCLENDILKHARQVMQTNRSKLISYDALDDDEVSWLLGIGCGGMVQILLQPVTANNNYLQLETLQANLQNLQDSFYFLNLKESDSNSNSVILADKFQPSTSNPVQLLKLSIRCDPLLVIFGGGVDAIPIVNMADELGWRTYLVDHRVTSARPENFARAYAILRQRPEDLLVRAIPTFPNKTPQLPTAAEHWLTQCDAAIVMTHNLTQDAAALTLLSQLKHNKLKYIGLLGPETRKQKVLLMADLQDSLLPSVLHGPMGFDIGGELPESIALSILSEIHAVLEGKTIPTSVQAGQPKETLP